MSKLESYQPPPDEIKKAEEIMTDEKKGMGDARKAAFDAGYAQKEKEERQEAESFRARDILQRFVDGEILREFEIHLVGGNQIHVSSVHRGRGGGENERGIIYLAGYAFVHDENSGYNERVDFSDIEKITGHDGKIYFNRQRL